MRRVFYRTAPILLIFMLLIGMRPFEARAVAGVPRVLSYQGRLTDSTGVLLGGTGTPYYFRFSIWDASSVGAGTKLWPAGSPGTTTLTVTDGVFNASIGDTTNGYPDALTYNFEDNDTVYLQIEVSPNGLVFETLGPRQRITSAATAVNAASLRGLVPGTGPTNLLTLGASGEITLASGGVSTLGNVSLGTVSAGTWNGGVIGDAYLTKTGDWTGTFDGQEGSYYLNATNLTNFATPFATAFATKTTDDLGEGSINQYFTNARFDTQLATKTTDDLAEGSVNKYFTIGAFDTAFTGKNISLLTNDAGYLTAFTELDPLFTASDAAGITATNISNWDTAYGWGDHSVAGYLLPTDLTGYATESFVTGQGYLTSLGAQTTDNLSEGATNLYYTATRARSAISVSGSPLAYNDTTGVLSIDVADGATDGYLSSTDWNTFSSKQDALGYTPANIDGSNATGTWTIAISGNAATVTNGVYTTGSYADPAWITSLAYSKISGVPAFLTSETDPLYTASDAASITATNISNWDTAYGWGDHAAAGYFNPSGLSAGSILFSNGTTITEDTANFVWDDTNNRFGIGTATPTSSLSVVATLPSAPVSTVYGSFFSTTGAGSAAQSQFGIGSTLNSGYTGSAATSAGWFSNSSAGTGTGFVLGNSGAYGATDSTTTGLNAGFLTYAVNRGSGNAVGTAGVVFGGLGSGSKVGLVGMTSNEAGGSGARVGIVALGGGAYNSGLPSLVSAAFLADNQAQAVPIFVARDNGSEVFRIADGGNVGIGITAPLTKLHIEGNFGIGGGQGIRVRNTNASGYSELVFANDTDNASGDFVFGYGGTTSATVPNQAYFANRNATPISFWTNNLQRMTLDGSGNLGLGTTTPLAPLELRATRATMVFESSGLTGTIPFTDTASLGAWASTEYIGAINQSTQANGGLAFSGFTNSASVNAFALVGHVGSASPTAAAVLIQGWKSNGTTGRTAMTGAEKLLDITPGAGTAVLTLTAGGSLGLGDTTPSTNAKSLSIASGTLADLISGMKYTATMPTTMTGNNFAINYEITGAGTSNVISTAFNVDFLAGYTGANRTVAGRFVNRNAGTGTSLTGATGNLGAQAAVSNTTTGTNVGLHSQTSGGNINVGAFGLTTTAKNSAVNLGVLGLSLNTGTSPIQVGGFFGLYDTDPTFNVSSALIADNGGTTSPIFLGRDNGTTVFSIIDGGNVGIGTSAPQTLLHASGASPAFRVNDTNGDNASFYGNFLDSAQLSINRNPSTGVFVNTGKAAAQFAMSGVNGESNFIFYTTTVNNSIPLERMRITGAGSVGIGTTSPSARLHTISTTEQLRLGFNASNYESTTVGSTGVPTRSIVGTGQTWNFSNTGKDTGIIINRESTSRQAFIGLMTASASTSANPFYSFGTGIGSSNFNIQSFDGATVTPRITLTPTGNVGIGTSSPGYVFDVQIPSTGINQPVARFKNNIAGSNTTFALDSLSTKNSNFQFNNNAVAKWYVGNDGSNDRYRILNSDANSNAEVFTILQNGNVGIGTTAPGTKLDITSSFNGSDLIRVNNTSSGTGAQATYAARNNLLDTASYGINGGSATAYGALAARDAFLYSTQNLTFMTDNASGVVKFATGGNTERMRIAANGNVGIGATSPSFRLDVQSSAGITANFTSTSTGTIRIQGTNNTVTSSSLYWNGTDFPGFFIRNTSNTVNATAGTAFYLGTNGNAASAVGGVQEAANSLGALAFYTGGSGRTNTVPERMRIDSAGNVGIGTTTPGVSLDIAKDFAANDGLRLLDASGGYFQVTQSTATAGAFQPVFQGLATGNSMSALIFKGLQTTGTAPTNGTVRFIARDSTDTAAISATDIAFRFDNNSTAALSILGNGNVGIGTTGPAQKLDVVGDTGDTTVVRIATTSGNACTFNTTTGSFSCASDSRLKHDIASIDAGDALDKLGRLDPVLYHYNWQYPGDALIAGFIAQDFEQIFPELVSTDPITGHKSLSYAPLMPYVVSAVQQMRIQITKLPLYEDQTMMDRLTAFWDAIAARGEAVVEKMTTKELCVEDVCVTRDQFLRMVQQAGVPDAPSGGSTAPEMVPEVVPVVDEEVPDETTTVETPVEETSPESEEAPVVAEVAPQE